MNIFDYDDYKSFVRDHIASLPSKGRGEVKRLAEAVRVSSSTLSLVFSGPRDLSPEQGLELGLALGLKESKLEYFVLLVERCHAGSEKLKQHRQARVQKLRRAKANLKTSLDVSRELSREEVSQFYSTWYFAALMVQLSIPGRHTIASLSQSVGLSKRTTEMALDFLLSTGLCRNEKHGLVIGASKLHLDSNDPMIYRHHQNWRQIALDRFSRSAFLAPEELAVSIPFATSKANLEKLRLSIQTQVREWIKVIDSGKEEIGAILNLDFLKL
jgi:uncharacterized protein (TIGR02147 family)